MVVIDQFPRRVLVFEVHAGDCDGINWVGVKFTNGFYVTTIKSISVTPYKSELALLALGVVAGKAIVIVALS
jgi:hypothetical protein